MSPELALGLPLDSQPRPYDSTLTSDQLGNSNQNRWPLLGASPWHQPLPFLTRDPGPGHRATLAKRLFSSSGSSGNLDFRSGLARLGGSKIKGKKLVGFWGVFGGSPRVGVFFFREIQAFRAFKQTRPSPRKNFFPFKISGRNGFHRPPGMPRAMESASPGGSVGHGLGGRCSVVLR